MATGPYDLGPFQTLKAVNFPLAGINLWAMNRVVTHQVDIYNDITVTWDDIGATGSPPTCFTFSYEPDEKRVFANVNSTDDIWQLDLNTSGWSFYDTLLTGSENTQLSSNAYNNIAYFSELLGGFRPNIHKYNTATGASSFLTQVSVGIESINYVNHFSSAWDPTRNLLLLLVQVFNPASKTIWGISPGGGQGAVYTLNAAHSVGNRFSGIDVQSDGTIWFASNKSGSSNLLLCSWDGSTFTEHVYLTPTTGGINLEGIVVAPDLDDLVLIANNLSVFAWGWDGNTLSQYGNMGGGRHTFATGI